MFYSKMLQRIWFVWTVILSTVKFAVPSLAASAFMLIETEIASSVKLLISGNKGISELLPYPATEILNCV